VAKKKPEGDEAKAAVKKAAKADKAAKGEKAAKPEKKKAPKRSRKKEATVDRFRIYWGVFNHTLKRVALYEFNQKKAADKRASELNEAGKPPHFVQKIKELIDPSAVTTPAAAGDDDE
jgi:hypothetical protein